MPTNEALFALLKYDDDAFEAFTQLYNRFWDQLYLAAYKRVKSKETAEEIVQEFFTKLWVNRKEVTIKTSPEAYLFTAIKYLVLTFLEKEMVRNNYKSTVSSYESVLHNSTQETVYLNELKEIINKEVQNLPPKCRSVYQLSRTEYMSNKDIAAELGISEKTVENHLTKALKRLRIGVTYSLVAVSVLFY